MSFLRVVVYYIMTQNDTLSKVEIKTNALVFGGESLLN